MDQNIADRAQKLANINLRFFYHPSYDDQKLRKEITGDMPDFEAYERNLLKMRRSRSGKINPEMLPCYESPLLNFSQEQHLFRKMNYYRYRASVIIASIDLVDPCLQKVENAEEFLECATEVRNQIASANFRLATQIMKYRLSFTKELNQSDCMLSDGYFDVLKAVDYFDWTRGHRFSTYATWVIKKNYFREAKVKSGHAEKVGVLDDQKADLIEGRGTGFEEEKAHGERQEFIFNLIGMMVRENLGTDRVRQAFVLENYFGINGRDRKTLEQISDEIGVTKERVRQLKEKGLEWIRDRVVDMGVIYDPETADGCMF